MRDGRQQRVVRLGVERRRVRPEVDQHAVQALVEDPAGPRRRRQVPGGALEQVGARVLDPGGLGAGQRVAADEPRVVHRRDHRPLGRADVGDHAFLARGREHLTGHVGQRAHRRGHERHVRAAHRVGRRAALLVDRAELGGAGEHAVRRVMAAHARAKALTRGEPDRAADQAHADHGDDGPARTSGHRSLIHNDGPTEAAVDRAGRCTHAQSMPRHRQVCGCRSSEVSTVVSGVPGL